MRIFLEGNQLTKERLSGSRSFLHQSNISPSVCDRNGLPLRKKKSLWADLSKRVILGGKLVKKRNSWSWKAAVGFKEKV